MSILDLLDKDRASRMLYEKDKEKAFEMYLQEKEALKAIAATAWFVTIRNYWKREKEICEKRLATMKSEDIKWVQAELLVATRFLEYLENMLTDIVI